MKKKLGFSGLLLISCLILSNLIAIPVLISKDDFSLSTPLGFRLIIGWVLFLFVMLLLVGIVIFINKLFSGKLSEIVFFLASALLMSNIVGFVFYALAKCHLDFTRLDWYGFFNKVVLFDYLYYGIVLLVFVGFVIFYGTLVDRRIFKFIRNDSLNTNGRLKQVDSNLENSRWMTEKEKESVFNTYKFSKLGEAKKDGIPVAAKLANNEKDMEVSFMSPCHSLVIGSTGSGKTTTFVSPMIQLLAAANCGSSMIITDPKGELFSLHSKFLADQGYDVKVIDLRDTYSSFRWNPLESIWDNYQLYLKAHKNAYAHSGDISKCNLTLTDDIANFKQGETWYEFEGKAYSKYEHLVEAIKIYKKKIYDEIYEDLNDLCSILIPVENEKDPMWEKGARSITLAVLLAMLEDAANPELNMTKDKYNFFNMTKILQNSNKDYLDLRNYFKGRSPLSKAYSLSKQVCDAATQTRASYMSIVYEKLTMFNDAGICALTSSSDFNSEGIALRPTALFLKIPDEKDTRHNLAAIFILNIYKTLIKIASAKEDLTLDRNVYFIMDEFGNMPKIEKFDKFITVGRSRKIWFTMIVQSYAQLNNVYGETVADIVKGNCGIKMFIGSNDMETCKEYSELCGNITVATSSVSYQGGSTSTSTSTQTQVRPLIYPSELQRLNHPGDIGHSIIVTFGNFPLKTYFTPSFKVKLYHIGKMDTSANQERFFDENSVFYDISNRYNLLVSKKEAQEEPKKEEKLEREEIVPGAGLNSTQAAEDTQIDENEEVNSQESIDKENEIEEVLSSFASDFKEFKEKNPEGSIEQFYEYMAGKKRGDS